MFHIINTNFILIKVSNEIIFHNSLQTCVEFSNFPINIYILKKNKNSEYTLDKRENILRLI